MYLLVLTPFLFYLWDSNLLFLVTYSKIFEKKKGPRQALFLMTLNVLVEIIEIPTSLKGKMEV